MKMNSIRPITVSVVIPTIGRQSVVRAIDSVCSQVGGMLSEIVVCFDNTENTTIPDHDHTKNGVNIRVVHNRGQRGVASTLNCAIKDATGTLIAWLSDDDYFSAPIKLLRVVNVINRNGLQAQRDGLFFFSDFYIFNDDLPVNTSDRSGVFNPHINYIGAHVEKLKSHYEYGQRCLSKGLVNGCTAVFSKALWTMVGGFQVHKNLQTTQDIVFWMSIIEKSSITAYIEGADATSVQHSLQGQRTQSALVAVEVEQLKAVVHLKNLRDFQLKRFTLKAHFNFFYHCMLLSVTPVAVFDQPDDGPIRQLSKFEFEQNTIAVVCHADSIPSVEDGLAVWKICVAVFLETLGVGKYCRQFFDEVLHFYINVNNGIFRLCVLEAEIAVEFVGCAEYVRAGDILLDYRYVITGEFNELVSGGSTVRKNLETLLLREDLCEYWSYLDQRNMNITRVNKLIIRAPWSFTEKP
jgi:hypothetical protein